MFLQLIVTIDEFLQFDFTVFCVLFANYIPCVACIFISFYIWEILHSTIRKMVRQVTKLQKEIEEMKDRLEELERKVSAHDSVRSLIVLFIYLAAFLEGWS